MSLRGSVILGGHVRELETLKAAAELPVRGLIISSLLSPLIVHCLSDALPDSGDGWLWRHADELGCLQTFDDQ